MAVTKRPRGGPNNARKRQNYFGHCRARAYTFLLARRATAVRNFRKTTHKLEDFASLLSYLLPSFRYYFNSVHASDHYWTIIELQIFNQNHTFGNVIIRKIFLVPSVRKSSVKAVAKVLKNIWKISATEFSHDSPKFATSLFRHMKWDFNGRLSNSVRGAWPRMVNECRVCHLQTPLFITCTGISIFTHV